MNGSAVRAYLTRDWGLLEDETNRHRAEAYQADPTWAWRTAAALREAVSTANPSWPTAGDRDADLAHHLQLRLVLDRVSDELARRRRTR